MIHMYQGHGVPKVLGRGVFLSFLMSTIIIITVLTGCNMNTMENQTAGVVQFDIRLVESKATIDIGTIVTDGVLRLKRGALVRYEMLTIAGGNASATVTDLLVGQWQVDVQLYDEMATIIYSGTTTFVLGPGESAAITIPITRHTGEAIFDFPLPTEEIDLEPGLVFWNRLGSDAEVYNSLVGPDLIDYTGGEVSGDVGYVTGVFGNACTIAGGPYGVTARVHTLTLPGMDTILSPDQGTVECWVRLNSLPEEYVHNIYRLLDGAFGQQSGISFQVAQGSTTGSALLNGGVSFGGTNVSVTYDIASYLGEWIHVAFAYDRTGINGTGETLRLYLNGIKVAVNTDTGWGTTVGPNADVCGANDDCTGVFDMDNLKIFDYAKSAFLLTSEY